MDNRIDDTRNGKNKIQECASAHDKETMKVKNPYMEKKLYPVEPILNPEQQKDFQEWLYHNYTPRVTLTYSQINAIADWSWDVGFILGCMSAFVGVIICLLLSLL